MTNSQFKLGGRVQLQADSFNDSMNLIDGDGKTGSDLYFRRARVYISGDVYKDWAYKIQFNVVDSKSGGGSVEDLYIKWKRYGLANITMGKHKEPFSLEELTSSKYVTSIERSPINSFFAEGRNLGLSLSGATDFWGYGIGVFDNGNDDNGAQEFAYTGRVFLSPINRERALLHLGVGMSHRNAPNANLDRSVTQGIKKGDEVAVSVDPFDSQDIFGGGAGRQDRPLPRLGRIPAARNQRHRQRRGCLRQRLLRRGRLVHHRRIPPLRGRHLGEGQAQPPRPRRVGGVH